MKEPERFDYRIALAFGLNNEKWPKELISGVMFFDGLRITRRQFNAYRRSLNN